MIQLASAVIPFAQKLGMPLTKLPITVLQVNLGKRCNLACNHCHVEAGPKRTEEMSAEVCAQVIAVIERFPQIETVDLTGGAPEIHASFRPILEAARQVGKEVIVRSNLTIFLEPGFEELPQYLAQQQARVVASLPCYLEENVDQQRGAGVYQASIAALRLLNQLGYGTHPQLILDLIYNPPVPRDEKFSLAPDQVKLEQDYKRFLGEQWSLVFNRLFTITNLPIGRVKGYLQTHKRYIPYLSFLEHHYNGATVSQVMCRNELSVDYLGHIFDCDFNQMENRPAKLPNDEQLTLAKLLEFNDLDVIQKVQTANYCYGCTAGKGSSCGGALL